MRKILVASKRPDESVPCPRCHSLNTKFCYFNNYNLKQPRHFCRDCKRYWTAGGSLRNVPIGAGRRKHKAPAAPCSAFRNGSTAVPKVNSGNGTSVQIPSINHIASASSDGIYSPEAHGAMLWQRNGLVPAYGSIQPCLSQFPQKSARDVAENSSTSMASHGWMPQASQTNKQMLREGATKNAVSGVKFSCRHGSNVSENSCQHDDAIQGEKVTVVQDASCESKTGLRPSHIHGECDSQLSDGVVSLALPEMIGNEQQGEVKSQASSAAAGIKHVDGSVSRAESIYPFGLENTPISWSPLMWPWIWPLLVYAANSPCLTVEDTQASTINMTYISGLLRSYLYCPHASTSLPWWSTNWNSSNENYKMSSEEPVKKQGLVHVPKTLRMDRLDEAAYSSILKNLGITTLPQSGTEFLNTFQPKADVFQPQMVSSKAVQQPELHRHHLPHLNSATQSPSVVFQEGS